VSEFLALDDGRRIEFEFVGESAPSEPDIVMLHEGLGSVAMWKDFPRRVAAATGRRVLVYSRLGYGKSTPLHAPWQPDYMHREARHWLPEVLKRLEVPDPVLFGHSDGASIALIYAATWPRSVTALVLLAPHVMVEPLTISSIAKTKVAYETTELRDRLSRFHDDVDSTFRGWNDIWLAPQFARWDIEALLSKITAPTLAIQGVDDEYGTLDQIHRIKARVTQAQLCELPNCRHSPHRDQPDLVLARTAEFLARH
jgi:pimeloyl-ACP methyl ester carboxylesterase